LRHSVPVVKPAEIGVQVVADLFLSLLKATFGALAAANVGFHALAQLIEDESAVVLHDVFISVDVLVLFLQLSFFLALTEHAFKVLHFVPEDAVLVVLKELLVGAVPLPQRAQPIQEPFRSISVLSVVPLGFVGHFQFN